MARSTEEEEIVHQGLRGRFRELLVDTILAPWLPSYAACGTGMIVDDQDRSRESTQEDIVNFQQNFNGPWPLTTDGILVGTPSASFEEEMQGKITFAGGSIGPGLGTFNHENMH